MGRHGKSCFAFGPTVKGHVSLRDYSWSNPGNPKGYHSAVEIWNLKHTETWWLSKRWTWTGSGYNCGSLNHSFWLLQGSFLSQFQYWASGSPPEAHNIGCLVLPKQTKISLLKLLWVPHPLGEGNLPTCLSLYQLLGQRVFHWEVFPILHHKGNLWHCGWNQVHYEISQQVSPGESMESYSGETPTVW